MSDVVEDAVAVPGELLKCLVDAAQHGEHPEGDPACVREVKLLIGSLIPWTGHKLRFRITRDGVTAELICPETGGCEPVSACDSCGRNRRDDGVEPCAHCPADDDDTVWPECWLKTWGDNEDLTDFLVDDESIELTVNIEADFDGDAPNITVVRDDGTGVTA